MSNKKINVKQSNELTEAAYYLSVKAKRVLWLCLMQTYFSDDDDNTDNLSGNVFEVKVSDYSDIFSISQNQSIKDLKDGILEIGSSSVIFYPKDDQYDIITRPWLSEAGSRSKKGIWVIEFNPKLMPFIYGLSNQFTTYSIRDCGSLKSSRTIRLYESLSQFKGSGIWITNPTWLQERFQLPDSQKNNIAELKRTFLDPALKQINSKTPIKADYIVDSKGNIVFTII